MNSFAEFVLISQTRLIPTHITHKQYLCVHISREFWPVASNIVYKTPDWAAVIDGQVANVRYDRQYDPRSFCTSSFTCIILSFCLSLNFTLVFTYLSTWGFECYFYSLQWTKLNVVWQAIQIEKVALLRFLSIYFCCCCGCMSSQFGMRRIRSSNDDDVRIV